MVASLPGGRQGVKADVVSVALLGQECLMEQNVGRLRNKQIPGSGSRPRVRVGDRAGERPETEPHAGLEGNSTLLAVVLEVGLAPGRLSPWQVSAARQSATLVFALRRGFCAASHQTGKSLHCSQHHRLWLTALVRYAEKSDERWFTSLGSGARLVAPRIQLLCDPIGSRKATTPCSRRGYSWLLPYAPLHCCSAGSMPPVGQSGSCRGPGW